MPELSRPPRILDLFCGAGGAAVGYYQAGFDVFGVDHRLQRRYPFPVIYADALEFLDGGKAEGFDAVHASPPCQAYSDLAHRTGADYPDLIAPVRQRLEALGVPYVIENVEGAPLHDPVTLCGSMFGLSADGHQLRRHRLFETNFPLDQPACDHDGQPIGVYGTGTAPGTVRGLKANARQAQEAMGMRWALRREIAQAIPPAYTEFIGRRLIRYVPPLEKAA